MSTIEYLQQLEAFAQIMMGSPDQVSNADRTKAEEMFLNFQRTKNPFNLCQELMQITKNSIVLYHVGACLKNGVIREWSTNEPEKFAALFNELFDYINNNQLDHFVIEEFMLVAAIIFKRLALHELNKSESSISSTIINSLFQLVKSSSTNIIIRINSCCSLIQILLETCTLHSNSDHGISWYSHFIIKKLLEKNYLKEIFKTTIEALFEQKKVNLNSTGNDKLLWIKFNSKLLRICEIIFTWNFNFILHNLSSYTFISSHYAKFCDKIENNLFDPPVEWINLIIEANVVTFFFEIYVEFRKIDSNLLHSALYCLTQLSTMTLHRQISSVRAKFTSDLMLNTIKMCNAIIETLSLQEVVFISNLYFSICNLLRIQSTIKYCDPSLVKNFLDLLFKFTSKILMESAKLKMENNIEDFEKCNQSLDYLSNSIMIITLIAECFYQDPEEEQSFKFVPKKEYVAWSDALFLDYVRAHLSQPEGFLPQISFENDDEIQEFEEDDNSYYREQIAAMSTLAHMNLLQSVNLLTQLFIMKLQQFEACIRSESEKKQIEWTRLSEDIHWILMISNYVFHAHSDNEIPLTIVKLTQKSNVQVTQTALMNGDFTQNDIDPVVRYFIVLFKFIELEKQLLENNMRQWVSPQVSYSLACFIGRFMNTYLAPFEYDIDETSLTLNACFGVDSANIKILIQFFLNHLETKFLKMSSETKLMECSSDGLKLFTKFNDRIKLLRECESLQRLLQRFPCDPQFLNLSSSVRRKMYHVFMLVFDWKAVIDPLIKLYQTFCANLGSDQTEKIQENFIVIADFVHGVINAVNPALFQSVWNEFILPFFNDLAKVLKIVQKNSNCVQAILELLFHVSVCLSSYFSEKDSQIFYDNAVLILHEYALFTKGTFTMDANRLEEVQAEFIWIFKFLNDFSTQDIFQLFIAPSVILYNSKDESVDKVLLTSLSILMPLMNDQLLENEILCTSYFKLLEYVSQDAKRFEAFPIRFFESYLNCVEYALKANNINKDVKTIAFRILMELGIQTFDSEKPSEEMLKFLQPFFQLIIQFIFCELVRSTDLILRDAVGLALYALICCFKRDYEQIIRQVMSFVGDKPTENNICDALFQIVKSNGYDCHLNAARVAFKKQFSDFVNNLHVMLS
ncbi:Exportin-4 [Sarcoptes scabiei]|uniref:Exportin-4 n=1 Tax=Sarcoptes scabiei TaxID=52283 RepID=A0A834R913_SARSC|nr:Exportin-4 [Sarcoptes scabiei]